jgi:hypothetical protein
VEHVGSCLPFRRFGSNLNPQDEADHRRRTTVAGRYDETKFANSLAYHEREIEEELAIFEKSRQQMARILRVLPNEALRHQGVHSERGLISIDEAILIEIDYVPHHAKFIAEKQASETELSVAR